MTGIWQRKTIANWPVSGQKYASVINKADIAL